MSRHQKQRRYQKQNRGQVADLAGCKLCVVPDLVHCCGWQTEHRDGSYECERSCADPQGVHPVAMSCGMFTPCGRCGSARLLA